MSVVSLMLGMLASFALLMTIGEAVRYGRMDWPFLLTFTPIAGVLAGFWLWCGVARAIRPKPAGGGFEVVAQPRPPADR